MENGAKIQIKIRNYPISLLLLLQSCEEDALPGAAGIFSAFENDKREQLTHLIKSYDVLDCLKTKGCVRAF